MLDARVIVLDVASLRCGYGRTEHPFQLRKALDYHFIAIAANRGT